MVDGKTAKREVENLSRRKKLDCDVLVVTCTICEAKKRFPMKQDHKLWSADPVNIA